MPDARTLPAALPSSVMERRPDIGAAEAALERSDYLEGYRAQVAASKQLVYDACDRLGLHYWPSEANFVLVRVGPTATDVVKAMAQRGVFVRDRSREPGCSGCVRITAGIVDHTVRGLAALEGVLCAAR